MAVKPLFTRKQLKDLASQASFDRGVAYYNAGNVRQVIRRENSFEGKVSGSSRYRVQLEVKASNLRFECNCPYDYEGICKHAVALGLAVISGDYQSEARWIDAEEAMLVEADNPEAGFAAAFEQASPAIKLDFLAATLAKDETLRAQFVRFAQQWAVEPDGTAAGKKTAAGASSIVNIEAIRTAVYQQLSEMTLDELDYEEGDEDDYYEEGWEESERVAEGMITEVFKPYVEKAADFFQRGDLGNGCRIILGLYEGASPVTEPASDDLCIFEGVDYDETVMASFGAQLADLVEHVQRTVLAEPAVRQALDLLAERARAGEGAHLRRREAPPVQYRWKHFEPLLRALLTSPVVAQHWLDLLTQHNWVDSGSALVLLQVAELTDNEALWLQTSEDFIDFEPTLAQPLLERYRAQGREKDFYRIARNLLKNRAGEFDQYLLETVSPAANRALYVSALESVTQRTHSLAHYLELRNYWTTAQRQAFITAASRGYDYLFYVQLLQAEGQLEAILQLVQRVKFDGISNFELLLRPIVSVYPTACFELVVSKCQWELANRRGRQGYQQMARWLKELTQAESLVEEVKAYGLHLYNSKPVLPALREELKNVGLG